MRKILILPILLAVLSGCSSHKPRVALFLYNGEDLFMQSFADKIVAMAGMDIELSVFDAQNSQLLQNEHIENQIKEGCDLMLINPVDRLGAYSVIRRLKSENIPVIYFNREPLFKDLLLWEKTWYVGAKANQSGQMQAELVMELFGNDPGNLNRYDRNGDGRIQTVILKGEQGHQDAEIRTSEVVRSFRLMGFDLDILITEVANWDKDEAYEKMDDIIKTYGHDMELVLANNDAMALGAIRRMRQKGMFKDSNGNGRVDMDDDSWIPVLGIDGLEQAVQMIEEGYLYGTVINDSLSMARAMRDLSEAILNGRNIYDLPYRIEDNKYIWIDYQAFIKNH